MGNRSSSSGHRAWRALGPVGAWAAAGTCKARPARPRLPATGLEGTTVRRSALAAYLPLHCSFTTSAATACAIIIITVVVVAFDVCFVIQTPYHWQGLNFVFWRRLQNSWVMVWPSILHWSADHVKPLMNKSILKVNWTDHNIGFFTGRPQMLSLPVNFHPAARINFWTGIISPRSKLLWFKLAKMLMHQSWVFVEIHLLSLFPSHALPSTNVTRKNLQAMWPVGEKITKPVSSSVTL